VLPLALVAALALASGILFRPFHLADDPRLRANFSEAPSASYAFDPLRYEETVLARIQEWALAGKGLKDIHRELARAFDTSEALAAETVDLSIRALEQRNRDWDLSDREGVLSAFETFAEAHPKDWLPQQAYAEAMWVLGDCDEADLDALIARWPDPAEAVR
jgi:hypothetical protein